ncbi:MAG: ABC transporter substrate-binding protein [Bacteroidales bacterium]|nr:ABC transporter substrate-binding protein [Bacteroidales bacterium]
MLILVIILFSCNQGKNKNSLQDDKDTTDRAKSINKKVVFIPYWVATAQFAGYYVANEKGIYEKYGLSLVIKPYLSSEASENIIKKGGFDFAVLWLANAIELKDQGADLINITQLSTRSSLMLLTKKSTGINTIKAMDGKRAGIWKGYEMLPQALFKKNKIKVNIIPIGSTNNLFLNDAVEITNANWFDEYHSIINSGINEDELNTFFFSEYGFNFLEDGLYCSSYLLNKKPKLCSDFVKETLEGWNYAFNNIEEAIDIVVKYAERDKVPVNRIHQKWMLARYKDLYMSNGSNHINTALNKKDYNNVAFILFENNFIQKIQPYNQFYKPLINK